MDAGLIAWGRRVKRGKFKPLWLFTDAARLPDPLPALRKLPRGLCGVVFRHDDAPDRLALGRQIAALCRARDFALVVAGDARLAAALQAGLHLRGGRRGVRKLPKLVTASAHSQAELARARRAKAGLIFISPLFPTASHPGAAGLGTVQWRRLARTAAPAQAAALGGVTGRNILQLGRFCKAAGAIGALAQPVKLAVAQADSGRLDSAI